MSTARAIAKGLDRVSVWLHYGAMGGAVFAVLVMLAAAGWQVFARYLLAQPPAWTEELARFSMVWGGLLGASCAYRLKADPTLFPDSVDRRGRLGVLLVVIRSAGVLILVLTTLWFCAFGPGMNLARGYVARLVGRQAETMDLPMIVFGVAIPIAFTIIVIHVLADLARVIILERNQSSDGLTTLAETTEKGPPL